MPIIFFKDHVIKCAIREWSFPQPVWPILDVINLYIPFYFGSLFALLRFLFFRYLTFFDGLMHCSDVRLIYDTPEWPQVASTFKITKNSL